MITRRHIRRWLVWAGVGVGILGLAGYVLSAIAPIERAWSGDRYFVAGRGGFAAYWIDQGPRDWNDSSVRGVDRVHWVWLPRYHVESPNNSTYLVGRVIIPYWVLILIGAVAAYRGLPSGYPRGRCQKCGYDLKGVPVEGGGVRCPECGERYEPRTQ